jgi:hypothetical protein
VPLGEPDANGIYPSTAGVKVATPSELSGKKYGDTCYTYDCGGTYKWYLQQYIDTARNAGAIPVLVTPVSRMYYSSDGTIKAHHDSTDATTGTQVTSNNAYVTAVKQLASEQNVLLVDGFELTKTLFEDAYKAAGSDTYGKQIMNTGDKTHNNKLGGIIEAAAIASAVQNMGLNISYAVKSPSKVQGSTQEGTTVFTINAKSELTAYDINSEYAQRASYWEEQGQKMIDAIATKASELNSVKPETPEDPETPVVNNEGLKVKLLEDTYTYTGSAIIPEFVVTYDGVELKENVDYTAKYKNNINASDDKATITITLLNNKNHVGSASTTFKISKKDLSDEEVKAGNIVVISGKTASPVLVYNGVVLGSKDYSYDKSKKFLTTMSEEDLKISVTGKGNYTGSLDIPVKVVASKNDLKKFTVEIGKEKLTYNGKEQKISFTVKDANKNVVNEIDDNGNVNYTVLYSGNTTDAGTVKFTVIGLGEYTGSVSKSYKINPLKASDIEFTGTINKDGYELDVNGTDISDDISYEYKGVALEEGKDYKITYSNNKKVGTGKYSVSFLGNYKGSKSPVIKGEFSIKSYAPDESNIVVAAADKVYSKPNIYTSKPYVTVDNVLLKASDYEVKYYTENGNEMSKNNKIDLSSSDSATITVKVTGKGNYSFTKEASYKVWKDNGAINLTSAKVTVVDENGAKFSKAEYTGQEITPNLIIASKKGTAITSEQFEKLKDTITYVNNVNAGTATVIINGNGTDFIGSKIVTFRIVTKNLRNILDLFK